MVFVMRFFIRLRLRRFAKLRMEHYAQGDYHTPLRWLLKPFSERVFRGYNRLKGSRVEFTAIRRNVERCLQLLDEVNETILEKRRLPRKALEGMESAIEINLDDWLETIDHYAVQPDIAYRLMLERGTELLRLLDTCDVKAQRVAYTRQLKYVFIDTTNALEALLRGAL